MTKGLRWSVSLLCAVALQLLILPVLAQAALAPAPPNDNFEDRTFVEGADVLLTGTLAGGTIEPGEPALNFERSVWWSWQAPASGTVLVWVPERILYFGRIHICTGTNLAEASSFQNFISDAELRQSYYTTFNATAGSTYQIGIFGSPWGPSNYSLRLALTNLPAILESPQTQTVSRGGSALFTVRVAINQSVRSSLGIRWQFNGNDLPQRSQPYAGAHECE
jgi:hypothetical protein